jgi:hypothetical protein
MATIMFYALAVFAVVAVGTVLVVLVAWVVSARRHRRAWSGPSLTRAEYAATGTPLEAPHQAGASSVPGGGPAEPMRDDLPGPRGVMDGFGGGGGGGL